MNITENEFRPLRTIPHLPGENKRKNYNGAPIYPWESAFNLDSEISPRIAKYFDNFFGEVDEDNHKNLLVNLSTQLLKNPQIIETIIQS